MKNVLLVSSKHSRCLLKERRSKCGSEIKDNQEPGRRSKVKRLSWGTNVPVTDFHVQNVFTIIPTIIFSGSGWRSVTWRCSSCRMMPFPVLVSCPACHNPDPSVHFSSVDTEGPRPSRWRVGVGCHGDGRVCVSLFHGNVITDGRDRF